MSRRRRIPDPGHGGIERSARLLLGARQMGGKASRAVRRIRRLLLLKTKMGSGHFGASGRYEYLKETAFNYSFLLRALGVFDARFGIQ